MAQPLLPSPRVALCKGGVDRNDADPNLLIILRVSPSARGAWIALKQL